MAAKRSSANAVATDYLGLVPDTDLPELYPGLKYSRQVFYQFSEVDPAVSCKVEEDLVVVKGIFCIDELHIKVVLLDLFKTNLKGLFLFFPVGLLLLIVLGAGGAKYCLKGLDHLLVLDVLRL